jgi:opacity protein-like surface antigen
VSSEDPSSAQPPASTSLANRYGSQKRALTRGAKRNIVIVALLAAVAFMAWIATSSAQAPVTFKDIGYSTVDATQAEVDFQVTKYPGATAKCAVKALDSKFAVVGWKLVEIGPNEPKDGADGGRTTAQRTVLRTESQAVSGVVDNCWIVDSGK